MDDYVCCVDELFLVVWVEFKYLEYFYFYNCFYEGLWCDNCCCWIEIVLIWDVLNCFGCDYKVIVVGDVLMLFYEIVVLGGVNEYWNFEVGEVWLCCLCEIWFDYVWLNLVLQLYWCQM